MYKLTFSITVSATDIVQNFEKHRLFWLKIVLEKKYIQNRLEMSFLNMVLKILYNVCSQKATKKPA